jgi:hypothetical protein
MNPLAKITALALNIFLSPKHEASACMLSFPGIMLMTGEEKKYCTPWDWALEAIALSSRGRLTT